ncbi:MAG: AEC family transporter [Armatimonadota bacterium]
MQLIEVVLALFIVVLAGYIAKKRKVLAAQDTGVINRIIVDFALPALIFRAVYQQTISRDMMVATGVFIAAELITLGLAFLVIKPFKMASPIVGTFAVCAAFGNTGFLGYPVTTAAYSAVSLAHSLGVSLEQGKLLAAKAMATAVMYDQIGMFVVLYLVAVPILVAMGRMPSRNSAIGRYELQKAVFSPSFLALVVTLLLNVFHIQVPNIVLNVAATLAGAVVPLVMISLGLMLETRQLMKRDSMGLVLGILVMKMAVMPLIIYLGTAKLGLDPLVRAVSVTSGAMPPAMLCAVLSERYGCERGLAAATAILGALLVALSMPLLMTAMGVG